MCKSTGPWLNQIANDSEMSPDSTVYFIVGVFSLQLALFSENHRFVNQFSSFFYSILSKWTKKYTAILLCHSQPLEFVAQKKIHEKNVCDNNACTNLIDWVCFASLFSRHTIEIYIISFMIDKYSCASDFYGFTKSRLHLFVAICILIGWLNLLKDEIIACQSISFEWTWLLISGTSILKFDSTSDDDKSL